jgi:riboflavin kinase/FMN adenylyltransferase
VLTPDKPLKMINSIDERVRLLNQNAVQNVVVKEFTKEFSEKSALSFIKEELLGKLKMKHLIVGYDHSFGKGKEGDFETLSTYGKQFGFEVTQVAAYQIGEVITSSTSIRNLLNIGDIERVNTFLDYPFCLFGMVVKGNQLGRKIGFHTANIVLDYPNKIIPKTGVYVVISTIDNQSYYGMMNIGYRPTVDGKTRTIEVHYFELKKNLYDKKISVRLLTRLRDEFKFDSIELLKMQLEIDKKMAKEFISQL